MRAARLYWTHPDGWADDPEQPAPAGLVPYFGSRQMLPATLLGEQAA